MISILMAEGIKGDSDLVALAARELLAHLGNETLKLLRWEMKKELESVLAQTEHLEAAILDVTVEGGIAAAKELRRRFPEIEILIISNASISPITYLNPQVRPASLLLKPLQAETLKQTLLEFFRLFELQKEQEEYMLVERKGEKMRLPYRKIRYLEARDKRVFARMCSIEYGISDTLDHLAVTLPEEFIRCHRSYIVNFIYIEKVRYSENTITLTGELMVPLSRSYKAVLRELLKDSACGKLGGVKHGA